MLKYLIIFMLPVALSASPDSVNRRVQAFLLIGDTQSAVHEAEQGVAQYPDQPRLFQIAIKSLGTAGQESEMVALWEKYHARFPEKAMEQETLEQMAWAILRKGLKAHGLASQLIGIIGAALTQDMYAVPFLVEGLRHTNARIRAISVQLAAIYADQPLKEEIARMFHSESVLEVRLEIYEALSKLRMEELISDLIARIGDSKISAKEKHVAIKAIVNFRESVSREELEILASSKRGALRELACEAIAHCEQKEDADILHRLVEDSNSIVQAAALKGLGFLRIPPTERIENLAQKARDPSVGIAAGWVWILAEPERGEEAFGRWFSHKNPEVQALAAAALAAAGPYGIDLARAHLKTASDPYVQANLAVALIGQREGCEEACAVLDRLLHAREERWMLAEEGLFRTLAKSRVTHNPVIPNYPEVVDQTVRLEFLNMLAILEYPGVQDAIKTFLKQRQWGVTGLAAEMLLGEGDETAIDHVRVLLDDKDPQIRAEAALVLATWGRDPTAIPHLHAVYPKGDRQLQIKILEALGRIGDRKTIPFLIERFKEPSLMLRMIAASVLIQTLNS
ncbi:MAG: HEAT repeat domain-containing protein [Chlamydiales bacterium]|nr:HEAT repeat domain-containing protein [Chlamydiales bacterium]